MQNTSKDAMLFQESYECHDRPFTTISVWLGCMVVWCVWA